jgi:hypothetical protein
MTLLKLTAYDRLQPVRLLATGLLLGNGAALAASDAHEYTISVDNSLSRLVVEARFSHPVDRVAARSRDAAKFLLEVRGCSDDQPVTLRNRRMVLPDGGINCMTYTVDLERAAKEHRYRELLAPENIIVSPSYWMWRPEVDSDTTIRIEFRLPEDIRVSVPWRRLGRDTTAYELSLSPESAYAPAVFGAFDFREIEVPGATLRVTLVRSAQQMDNDAIVRWIDATATDVSLAYGRFPNPSPQVVVIPVGDSRRNSRSAAPFGRVIRDGGETVELLVDQTQPLEALLGDWTATHEFSHLMLPYVDRKHRWISEGFAQYYQNVLLSRSGAYNDLHAWQKIHDGYERGRRSRPELSPNEAAAGGVSRGLMKVYWSGAALALMADVKLREQSGGEETLDVVLGRLQQCCLPSDRTWSGTDLFAKMDSLTRYPVFMQLYRRYADTAGFPEVRPLMERLGLSVSNGKVRLRRHAELAGIRLAITETNAAAADWRHQLAANQ